MYPQHVISGSPVYETINVQRLDMFTRCTIEHIRCHYKLTCAMSRKINIPGAGEVSRAKLFRGVVCQSFRSLP